MKRSIYFFLALIILIGIALPSYSAYVESADKFNKDRHQYLDIIYEEDWRIVSGVGRIQTRNSGAHDILYVSSNGENEPIIIEYKPEKAFSFKEYNELCFDISVNGGKGNCIYKLTYHTENGAYTDEIEVGELQRSIVRFKIPEVVGEAVDSLEFSVEKAEAMPQSCTILGIYGDDFRTYSYAQLFSSYRVETLDGVSTYYDDHIEIVPDENGSHLRCHLTEGMNGATAMITLRVYSPFAGIMTVENEETDKTVSAAMYSGEALYSFAVSGVEDVLKIGFAESGAGGSAVHFRSMDIVRIADKDPVTYGAVESCVYNNGKISVKGTVSPDAAVKYIDAKLALYKLPCDTDDYSNLPESECEMGISTVFTLSSNVSFDHTQYKYLVALKTREEVVPLCAPVFSFVQAEQPPVSPECSMSVHRVESATVFESGADDVFVDVNASELFAADSLPNSVRYSFREGVYDFDREKVKALENDIGFYVSVGCRVYLNIIADDLEKLDETNEYCALVAFAGEHFGKASGIVVSAGSGSVDDIIKEAEDISLMLGQLKSVLSNVAPAMEFFVFFEEGQDELAACVSYYNGQYAINNISLVYGSSDGENAVARTKSVSDSSHRLGCSYRKNAVLFTMEKMNEVEQFSGVFDKAQQNGLSFAVFSKGEVITDEYAREMLTLLSEKGFEIYDLSADAEDEDCEYVSFWNFNDSYDTFGWLAGGGCSTPETVKYMLGEGRAMRTRITPHRNGEGILVCWLDGVKNLSGAEKMKLEYGLSVEDQRNVSLRVVLGADGSKAEYEATVGNGEGQLVLDLEMFPRRDKLEYVAIIVEISAEAVLDITDISIGSSELSEGELMALISPKEENVKDMASLYIFAGAVVSVTVVVFAVLTKRKKTVASKK